MKGYQRIGRKTTAVMILEIMKITVSISDHIKISFT